MPGIFNNILETIGRTPVVRLNKLAPKGVNVFVKIESFNPMGSVKDRLARGIMSMPKSPERYSRVRRLSKPPVVIQASVWRWSVRKKATPWW